MNYGYDNTMADAVDKYLKVVEWARKRYTSHNLLVIRTGEQDSVYTKIENLAWDRYLA